ncbi:hypothetical protein KIPB_011270 [Kipferlia bialata]|uniref:Uncharacterized protein n=1 Tax=Kipferlia bialata TaxID=797122 RepID=A0A9K3GN03_9EUKA|nr:hypothetical protein KIPB_011270 [Kipferlia bialata]|eukprot:g11270.t1
MAQPLKDSGKGVVFVAPTFLFGIMASTEAGTAAVAAIQAFLTAEGVTGKAVMVRNQVAGKVGKKKVKVAGVTQIVVPSLPKGLSTRLHALVEAME